MSSTPLSPMLKPSILMSRLVGRDVSTPVTVRVLAAAIAAADCSAWPLAGASARLAKLTSLCRSASTSVTQAWSLARAARTPCRRSRLFGMATGRRRRQARHTLPQSKAQASGGRKIVQYVLAARCRRCHRKCVVDPCYTPAPGSPRAAKRDTHTHLPYARRHSRKGAPARVCCPRYTISKPVIVGSTSATLPGQMVPSQRRHDIYRSEASCKAHLTCGTLSLLQARACVYTRGYRTSYDAQESLRYASDGLKVAGHCLAVLCQHDAG